MARRKKETVNAIENTAVDTAGETTAIGTGNDALLQKISGTLDALLAIAITEKINNGDSVFRFNADNGARRAIERVLRDFGLTSVNDGTFPRMEMGRGMGVPDVRYNGNVWMAYPVAGDVFVTQDVAEDIKFFAGDDCKGGN